MERKVIV